ncbi:unnamed protein product [Amoebophrya sp. A25]|nr:unnamed protein product [Amoebophrya sp. A25]|eukprot:GSA25T00023519001.1
MGSATAVDRDWGQQQQGYDNYNYGGQKGGWKPQNKGNGKSPKNADNKKKEPKEMTLEEYNAQKKAKAEAAKAAAAKKAAQPQEKAAPIKMSKEDLDKTFSSKPAAEGSSPTAKDEEAPSAGADAPAAEQGSASTPTTDTKQQDDGDNWDDDVSDDDDKAAEAAKKKEEEEAAAAAEQAAAAKKKAEEEAAAAKKKEEEAAAAASSKPDKASPDDAPEAEEEVVVKPPGSLPDPDSRPHANIVFIGHVDAGKSTTCGNILFLTGYVDDRTIEKYQREAKEKNRDSWFLAYIMDTSEEEKAKGKTVEVGRAQFTTENKRFTILDAPGHKSYVPNMISGASQADIGVLIISARKGEFETGFEKGGQTSEHAVLAKTLGVDKLIIAVNKMDDPSVQWKQERYDEIVGKMKPFLKSACQFKDDQVIFLPISGLNGDNLKERKNSPSWVTGETFFETIDKLDLGVHAKATAPLRIPMLEGYRDMGSLMAIGKVEQGRITPGMKCIVQPTGKTCTAVQVIIGEQEVAYATVGENITVKVSGGIAEEDSRKGFVLCPVKDPARPVIRFKAQFKILELVEGRNLLTSGYRCVVHFHTAVEDCEITKLLETMTLQPKKKVTANPKFARTGDVLKCVITLDRKAAMDSFAGCEKMGRFTLRDEGITVGIGKILELSKAEK